MPKEFKQVTCQEKNKEIALLKQNHWNGRRTNSFGGLYGSSIIKRIAYGQLEKSCRQTISRLKQGGWTLVTNVVFELLCQKSFQVSWIFIYFNWNNNDDNKTLIANVFRVITICQILFLARYVHISLMIISANFMRQFQYPYL